MDHKKLFVLRNGDNTSILFGHLYQTHIFSNNLNDGEMIIFHLMFELHYKTIF